MAGALDRDRQRALVARADTGTAAGQNLAAFGNAALQALHILIIDLMNSIGAELANLAPCCEPAAPATAGTSAILIIGHNRPHSVLKRNILITDIEAFFLWLPALMRPLILLMIVIVGIVR